jgi:hypothetical protein
MFLPRCRFSPRLTTTAVSELLYAKAAQSRGVFLKPGSPAARPLGWKKTPPFFELKRAHEL